MTFTPITIKPSEIYKNGWTPIYTTLEENNYYITDFRIPLVGDSFIKRTSGNIDRCRVGDSFNQLCPRYIVAKRPSSSVGVWE